MNKMLIIGNLTSDPVIREIAGPNGPLKVCNFDVAVNERRNGVEKTTYFRIAAWRALAESCQRYLAKGKKVYVSGPLTVRSYQAGDGSTRFSLEIQANELEFLSPANRADVNDPAPAAEAAPMAQAPAAFQAVETDELPF